MATINKINVSNTNYDISTKQGFVTWGGDSLSGSVSPIGAALSSEHSANRLAFLSPNALAIEYSDNGGTSWTTGSWTDKEKIYHVTKSSAIPVGSATTVTTNHRTRVTLTAQNGTTDYVYTRPRKFLINVNNSGHGMQVMIEYKTGASDASWQTLGTYPLSGWSGWNDIDVSSICTFGGFTSQTTNCWYWRFTYSITSVDSSYTTTKATVLGMRLFGDTCWVRTSNMGDTGHLYSYDYQQNATFPAQVTASSFNASSDKRLKENLVPYTATKSILELPTYKYNFISDGAKTEHIGCLAQDLQEICPEIVNKDENGYLSIQESKIVYLLLDEVKKLKMEIDELKRNNINS